MNLHSTLVLLKPYAEGAYLLFIKLFTFHFGSIKTRDHSDDLKVPYLYLHSTLVLLKLGLVPAIIFFCLHLHSTLVLLKPLPACTVTVILSYLHSTLVLLKRYVIVNGDVINNDLHSTLVLLKPVDFNLLILESYRCYCCQYNKFLIS